MASSYCLVSSSIPAGRGRGRTSSNSTSSMMKLKTLLQRLIYSPRTCIYGAIHNAKKALLILIHHHNHNKPSNNNNFFASFRLYYNWASSHPTPTNTTTIIPDPHPPSISSAATATATATGHDHCSGELSSYLHWLEDAGTSTYYSCCREVNEIDKLADMFIANSHEKFRLEKEHSYRMFQEMMARSV